MKKAVLLSLLIEKITPPSAVALPVKFVRPADIVIGILFCDCFCNFGVFCVQF